MKKMYLTMAMVLTLTFVLTNDTFARNYRVNEIPNGSVNRCQNCHINPNGGGPRNDFGKQLFINGFVQPPDASGHVQWGPVIAAMDADNDGVTNGEELQDPFGFWKVGEAAPGNAAFVTLPADSQSAPLTKLKIDFMGMNPHVGQQFGVRVVDKATGTEVARSVLPSIMNHDFDVEFEDVVLLGHSYQIDFYADLNQNGVYDAPPVDHAWRMDADNLAGETQLTFNHNTGFTDIQWPYNLQIVFQGMNPHVGQLLEIRVKDTEMDKEVGRARVESISSPAFTVNLPVLMLNKNYQVDMYADLNKNGLYDAPGTDHSWREIVSNPNGDATLTFSHNTSFVDVQWDYELKFQLGKMNPHVGEMMEFRLVDASDQSEVSRKKVPVVPGPEFALALPGLQIGHSYFVDFYADHNKNGTYDAPPTDHAWHVSVENVAGNTIANFSHNTNFTDIQFPTGVRLVGADNGDIPRAFALHQNYPNPFNPETVINFDIHEPTNVKLTVFNTLGQHVKTLVDQSMAPGAFQAVWNGLNELNEPVNSGMYLYVIEANGLRETRRMLLLK